MRLQSQHLPSPLNHHVTIAQTRTNERAGPATSIRRSASEANTSSRNCSASPNASESHLTQAHSLVNRHSHRYFKEMPMTSAWFVLGRQQRTCLLTARKGGILFLQRTKRDWPLSECRPTASSRCRTDGSLNDQAECNPDRWLCGQEHLGRGTGLGAVSTVAASQPDRMRRRVTTRQDRHKPRRFHLNDRRVLQGRQ